MSYIANPPSYEAIQWLGNNVEDCQAFHLQWFPQPAPHPDWDPSPVVPPFAYNVEDQTLLLHGGYLVTVGDWMVNGGTWGPHSAWAGVPEVSPDVVFQEKYAQSG